MRATWFASRLAVRDLTFRCTLNAGAACETGTYCYTGRADATGGYCRLIGGAAGVAPVSAPEASASAAPAPAESVPSCTTAGTCPLAHSAHDTHMSLHLFTTGFQHNSLQVYIDLFEGTFCKQQPPIAISIRLQACNCSTLLISIHSRLLNLC